MKCSLQSCPRMKHDTLKQLVIVDFTTKPTFSYRASILQPTKLSTMRSSSLSMCSSNSWSSGKNSFFQVNMISEEVALHIQLGYFQVVVQGGM